MEKESKNWFRRHWILTIFICLFIGIGILTLFDESTEPNINEDNQKDYVDEELYELVVLFVNDDYYTDLQKKEEFKQYENKWIKSSGSVMEIDTVILSDSIVVAILNPENPYFRGATIYFKPSEKDKLLEIGKYDEISFEGKIEGYGGITGIIIKEAEVTEFKK